MSFKKILFRFTIFIPKFIKKIKYNYLYRLWNLLIVKDHKSELFIGGKTLLSSNTALNHNPNFNGMIIKRGGQVTIGDNFHSGEDCLILTSINDYDNGYHIPYCKTFIN